MARKSQKSQELARRRPQQDRAHNKVGLILEAAMRLIERDGIDALTTNAIAETAGISIGTLYQYFRDKGAVLQALTDRELGGLSSRVLDAVQAAPPDVLGGRIPIIVRAILSSYGGRRRVHRLLLEHALARGPANRLNPLYKGLAGLMSTDGIAASGEAAKPMRPADAFVLIHAFAGVMRAAVATENREVPPEELEAALTRLIVGFVQSSGV